MTLQSTHTGFYTDFKELTYLNSFKNFAITIPHLFSQYEQLDEDGKEVMLPQTLETAVNRCLFQFMLCIYCKCYYLLGKKNQKTRYSYNSSVKVICYVAIVHLVFRLEVDLN